MRNSWIEIVKTVILRRKKKEENREEKKKKGETKELKKVPSTIEGKSPGKP